MTSHLVSRLVRTCSIPFALALLAMVLAPSLAHAQQEISVEVRLPDEEGAFRRVDIASVRQFFNRSRCECSVAQDGPDNPHQFAVFLEDASGTLPLGEDLEVIVGISCLDNEDLLRDECRVITTLEVQALPAQIAIDVADLILDEEGEDPSPADCSANDGEETVRTVYVMTEDADKHTIVGSSDVDPLLMDDSGIFVDTRPPPAPKNPAVKGVENGIRVTWDVERESDVRYYQVLCADSAGQPPPGADPDSAEYTPPSSLLCGLEGDQPEPTPDAGSGGMDAGVDAGNGGTDAGVADASVADAGTPDGGTPDGGTPDGGAPIGDIDDLDPRFLCGTIAAPATSLRVGGLQNGEEYTVILLTVDRAGNATPHAFGETVKPEAAVDFWEDYVGSGGDGSGGFCLVTSTYGDGNPLTQALRDFRDETLAQHAWGRALIGFYYARVAWLGEPIERHLALRVAVAVVLAPIAALAALWVYTGAGLKLLLLLAFIVWRRRRRAHDDRARWLEARWPVRALAASGALAVMCAAGDASAQGYDPYWSSFGDAPADVSAHRPIQWNVGIKLGPFLPDVDSEFDLAAGEQGPYARMFGGGGIMGSIELDRFFVFPLGQLGVTGSIGFTSNTANAFAAADCEGAMPPDPCVPGATIRLGDDGEPVRVEGDKTSFRVIPVMLGGVYRFTALDDQIGVPVVPYGKLGLSYYVWWVSQPSGGVAEAPTPDCPDVDECTGNLARGASLGWQGTLGLAIRAERLDPAAAMSLRNNYGVDHAGFYAELTYAKVDGFGRAGKLAVGDLTWFAGVNFEF